jgi:uncharacterized protein
MVDTGAAIEIEIVYAEPHRARDLALSLPPGARVADALQLAARDAEWASIVLGAAALGIHGQLVQRDQALNDGDRIEIYRPLAEDPKTARRKRARGSRA